MTALTTISYVIAFIGIVVFVILIFRKKADIDYMQEYSPKIAKVVNSSSRIMFFILHGWAVLYMTYQMLHTATIDLMVVVTVLGIAWGGKAGIDAIKKNKDSTT